MKIDTTNEIEKLKTELETSRRIIQALIKQQKQARSATIIDVGAFESMVSLERIVEQRTLELQKSQAKLKAANENLEKLIIERTRNLEAANREISIVCELNRQISTRLELSEVVFNIMNRIMEITGLKGGGLFLVDHETGELYSAGGIGLSDSFKSYTKKAKISKGISGTVAATGKTIYEEDLVNSPYLTPEYRQLNLREGLGAQLSVPLKSAEHVVGVMNFVSEYGQIIHPADISLLETIGNQLGVAIENAQLYRKTQKHLTELEALRHTLTLLTSSLDLDYILDTIALEAAEAFKADATCIMMHDETEEYFVIVGAYGLSDEYVKKQLLPTGKVDSAIEAGMAIKSMIIPNLQLQPFGNLELIKKENLFTALAAPFIKDDKLIGILCIYSKEETRQFSEHEINLARVFANQATIAMVNAMQYDEQVQSKNEIRTLYEIGQSIVSTLDQDQTLDLIINSVARLVPAYTSAILLIDKNNEELTIKAGMGHNYEEWKNVRVSLNQGITGTVASTGKPIIVPDVKQDSRYLEVMPQVKSSLCVPLKHKDKIIGVIISSSSRLNAYNQRHLDLLTSLANLAAVAIANASAYEQVEQWAARQAAIQKLGSNLNKILDVDTLANTVVNELKQVLEYDDCRFYILDEKKQELVALAHLGSEATEYQYPSLEVLKVKVGEGITGHVAKTGISELVPNATIHPHGITIPGTEDVDESMLLSPMVFENKVLGVISLSKLGLNQYTEDHLRLLNIFTDHAAIALENASLYEEKIARLDEIQRLKDFNEAIVKGLEEGIFIEDADGYITFVNPKMTEILECQNNEIIGKHWSEFIANRFHTIASQETTKRKQGVSSRYEAAMINKNGREIPVFISARPMYQKKEIVGVLVAVTDISLLKEMELKMIRSARLGALGEMAGGVAHDFNNVLGAILGRVQLLLRVVHAPELREGLQIIEKAALDGAETVKRIQDFTRTRTDERFIPLNINELVNDAVSMTSSRWKEDADAEGVVFNIKTNLGQIPQNIGNPHELREVLTNMIINAIDALPHGGNITIETSCDGENIILKVKDDGVGIPQECIDKIFDPFFSTKGVSGTGLGLSVSYGIIARHQGEIVVDSAPGKGSLFIVTLPVTQTPPETEIQEAVQTDEMPKLKLVVIDDDPMLRKLLADILQYDGHEVKIAASGAEGLKAVELYKPDIVFTDLGMPHMSGWEVVQSLKSKYPQMPVVMITGWGDQLGREKLVQSKVDAVIAKPFKIDQIQKVLSEFSQILKNNL